MHNKSIKFSKAERNCFSNKSNICSVENILTELNYIQIGDIKYLKIIITWTNKDLNLNH